MGILLPNIITFAWPMGAMTDYTVMGDTCANALGHTIISTAFLGKFMFLFALLFGSGVIMYARKFDSADHEGNYHTKLSTGTGLWYMRCGLLLVFGTLHAYLLWFGDILSFYAVAGLTLLWWIRRLHPKLQFFGGLGLYALGSLLVFGFSALTYWALSAGHITAEELSSDPAYEIAAYTGTYFDAFRARFITTLFMEILFLPLMLPMLWGIMAMGMGLTRMGILTGERPLAFYVKAAIILLGIGIPLTGLAYVNIEHTFDLVPGFIWQSVAQPIGVPLGLGYAALVIALSKCASARLICIPLAAVGRMALTNYFLQTILCTTFFYGYGFGHYASIDFPRLWLVIAVVWSINILFSMLWLRFFTMGPFEWIWRVMTYRKLVAIRA
tara:strand:- start:49099 stop:50250 length:1152 start_codon:yes stop_codon:yes gene_type:complete